MKKVLIVEDDYIISLTTGKMVEKSGCEVVGMVTTGEEAVEAALRLKPDAILMDIRLAGDMDGIEACSKILEEEPGIDVIYLTGNTDPVYKQKASETDYKHYLIKPVHFEQLKKILQ